LNLPTMLARLTSSEQLVLRFRHRFPECHQQRSQRKTDSSRKCHPSRAIFQFIPTPPPLSRLPLDPQTFHAPAYRRKPNIQRTRTNVNGTPSSQRMNPFPMMNLPFLPG
jgi:hypothetical protein